MPGWQAWSFKCLDSPRESPLFTLKPENSLSRGNVCVRDISHSECAGELSRDGKIPPSAGRPYGGTQAVLISTTVIFVVAATTVDNDDDDSGDGDNVSHLRREIIILAA